MPRLKDQPLSWLLNDLPDASERIRAALEAHDARVPIKVSSPDPTYSEMMEALRAGRKIYGTTDARRKATAGQRREMAQLLLTTGSSWVAGCVEWVFRRHPFPLRSERLLERALQVREQDFGLACQLLRAYGRTEHPDVRSRTMEMIRSGWPEAFEALKGWCTEEAAEEVATLLPQFESEAAWLRHSISLDLLRALDRIHGGVGVARWIYLHNPCTMCRRSVVSILQQRLALPDEWREECKWDADEATRELANIRSDSATA